MSISHPLVPHDVVIAGAGPVGLMLACELRLSGVSVLVLERAGDISSLLKRLPFGVRGLSVSSLDALHRRGLLSELLAEQRTRDAAPAHVAQQKRRAAGHFAGIEFFHDDIDVSRWRHRLPSAAGSSLAIEMESLETVLAVRARALGVEIRRGCGVETFEASDDGVTLRAGGQEFRTTWLVGCDGGRSAVRKAGGFDFVGTEPEFTGYFVDVELADPHALRPGRHYSPTGMYTFAQPGTIAMVAFDGGAFHRSGEITLEHVQAVLQRVSGTDVAVKSLRLATTWTDRAQQVTDYRIGRVLLAGDAAHIHSPLGGQGLNLGLGDAMNLGWKLAATIRGDAPAGLLDTYSRERHPVGAQVLDWSRAQVTLMRPTPNTRALEAIVRDLIATRDGATYFAERIWGVSLRYDLGGDHPLIGRSVPDFELADGTKVGSLLRDGRGLWLDFASQPARRALANGWSDRINYVADRLGVECVLVRPDGVIAWLAETDGDNESAARIAARWFGEPVMLHERAHRV